MRDLDYFTTVSDSRNAHAQRVCTDRPEQAHVRTALLKFEKEINQGGWDQRAKVFHLFRNTRSGKVETKVYEDLSAIVGGGEVHPAEALSHIAAILEGTRKAAFALDDNDPDIHRDDPRMQQAFRFASKVLPGYIQKLRADPTADLVTYRSKDWVFHGAGITTEAWAVSGGKEDAEDHLAAADRRQLHLHKDRIECRQTHVINRDGHYWQVQRLRRTPEINVPRWCEVTVPDDGDCWVGKIPNALSRMTAAIANNPVHIIPSVTTQQDVRDHFERNAARKARGQ